MQNYRIVPSHAIDNFEIGTSWASIADKLPRNEYLIEKHEIAWIVEWKYYKLWFEMPELKLTQIAVYQGYEGNFLGIRLGDTLPNVEQKAGAWAEYGFNYVLPNHKGIAFELADNDIDEEWIESEAPISAIYVYSPKNDEKYEEEWVQIA
jgi:hypothetical protein